jgi:glycosyltransferase involved in cell wall biosynthesis
VSVIIPTHNRAEPLSRAIESVLAQSYDRLEILVVVDGPDPAAKATLAAFGDRVAAIHLPASVGPGEARNRGVQAASGDWVAFLDDDDEWLPGKLARQMAVVRDCGEQMPFCYSRILVRDGRGERVWPRRPLAAGEDIGEYLFARRTLHRGEAMVPTITWLMPTALMRRLPFDSSLRRHEDADWLLRASQLRLGPWLFIEEPTAIWNIQSGAGHTSENHDWRDWYAWGKRRRQLLTPRAYAGWMLQAVAAHAVRAGDRSASLRVGCEALLHGRPGPLELLAFLGIFVTLRAGHGEPAQAEEQPRRT